MKIHFTEYILLGRYVEIMHKKGIWRICDAVVVEDEKNRNQTIVLNLERNECTYLISGVSHNCRKYNLEVTLPLDLNNNDNGEWITFEDEARGFKIHLPQQDRMLSFDA